MEEVAISKIVCQHCDAVDDYSTTMKNSQKVATCNKCGRFIKNIPYKPPQFYFGKYNGKLITDVEDLPYLQWVMANVRMTGHFKTAMEQQIFKLTAILDTLKNPTLPHE